MNRMMTKARHRQTNMPKTYRDADGRGQVLDLIWNLRGELVSVSTNGAFAEGYAYDALGRRVSTADASGTVYHAYDGIRCVADLASDGTLLRSYTWGAGVDIKRAQSPRRSRRATAILSPSRRDGARSGIPRRSGNCYLLAVTLYGGDSTNTLYAVTDPLGTVHALVASNGTSQLWFTYDSWGNITVASQPLSFSASQLRFTWQGREYSHATALYSVRARWYDPAAGRWLSKDPIGLEGGLNLYEAFGNNPVCFGDPDGGKIVNPQKDKRIDNAIQKIQNALVKAYKEEHSCPTKKGKRNQILKAFNHLLNTKVFEVHIYITSGENCYVSKKNTDNQTGKNLLYWNPDLWVSNLNSEGNKTRPPEIGLAHELAHAIDDVLGRLEYDVQSPSSNLHKNVGAPNNEERRAVEFENWVRDAMGVPLRILY